VSFTLINLDFEVIIFYLLALTNKQNNKNWWGDKWWNYMHDRQITRNNFVDSANTSQNFLTGLYKIFGFHWISLSVLSFASTSQSSFYFDKTLKCVIYVKFFHEKNSKPLWKCRRPATQSCKLPLIWSLNPKSQSRTWYLCLKSDLGPTAKCTECVKMCAAARHR